VAEGSRTCRRYQHRTVRLRRAASAAAWSNTELRGSPFSAIRINEATKSRIRDIILDWNEPNFTWDLLMEKINKEFGGKWSAWAVGKHPKLQEYFQITKHRIRKEKADRAAGKKPKIVEGTTSVLQDRVKHLQRVNEDLKKLLAECEARLARWRTNAALNKVRISLLDEKLQENNRGRSDR
jgi:uncharacterized NAD(P)/FAD-binding protein YdhS